MEIDLKKLRLASACAPGQRRRAGLKELLTSGKAAAGTETFFRPHKRTPQEAYLKYSL